MLDNLPKLWLLALIPLFALAFIIGASLFYYRGGYEPVPAFDFPIDQIKSIGARQGGFTASPGMQLRDGVLLVDQAHSNTFEKGEIATLTSRAADLGYRVDFVTSSLEEKLRGADSLAVILPRDPFSPEEVSLVERFVQKGGKLLLIADPTRRHDINSLARRFGLEFQPDYLFNQVEHDLNFRDIFVRDFQPHELTQGLHEIVLYSAGSIRSAGPGLAITDQNTRSSMVEQVGPLHPLALGNGGNVLAIYDLTFMVPPLDSISDNGQLLVNLADYLTTGRREFELADFPSFLKGDVDILLGESSLFNLGTELKSDLAKFQVTSQIQGVEDVAQDTVFLGLHDDSARVGRYLAAAGIHIGDSIQVPSAPDLAPDSTSIVLLHRSQDRHVLVVLAPSEQALQKTVDLLFSGGFRNGLVDDLVGVYKTE